jgi:hypothetical protein
VNAAPTAVAAAVVTREGAPVSVTLEGRDAESCELQFEIVTPPAAGTLGGLDGQSCTAGQPNVDRVTVTYTPAAGYAGADQFGFRVFDGALWSAPATISVTVEPEPEPDPDPDPDPDPVSFTDIATSPHAENILRIAEAGITSGYTDGSFRPNAPVTRGQMATLLTKGLGLTAGDASGFSDVAGHTHENGIGALVQAEITSGYADGTFRPNLSVTRGQMATFLTKGLELPPGDASVFSDADGHTHTRGIGALVGADIAAGYADGTFRPNAPVTRGQMATFLAKALRL